MIAAGRNKKGLTERQVEQCQLAWKIICGGETRVKLDTSEAHKNMSRTRFIEKECKVVLGADVLPGENVVDVNSRMSLLACLAHEFAHAERYLSGYDRPVKSPNFLIDEAETSLHASFITVINKKDREDLREDAYFRLTEYLKIRSNENEN
ncbi:hypothetical protein QUF90_24545 [Desulfococcaceae bacterium HSG9]|nr:hypothetical protein [Desulfococcaceae bacterium HSG9]